MFENKEVQIETVIAVTVKDKRYKDTLEELISLVENLDAEVVMTMTMHRDSLNASAYVGKGKIVEIKKAIKEFGIKTVVINDNISPKQKKILERDIEAKVLDRTEVILAIFARRAATKEAKLQVELAQLKYMLPRLTNLWTHLSRQQGGIGTKGVGEKQIELDRRMINKRISKLKKDLDKVITTRTEQRKKRIQSRVPLVALVGYTNSGKSTIFNYYKGKSVFAKDQLFATLDTITKRIDYADFSFYFIDTVGFISELPHFLVESFKATLEEVFLSDVLLHIVDVSNPMYYDNIVAVNDVLAELGMKKKKIIKVFNKVDLVGQTAKEFIREKLVVSAKTGENMEQLTAAIKKAVGNAGR